MVEDIERIWGRIKDRAAAFAERDLFMSASDSRLLVVQICREEGAERPPAEALEYLAGELLRMTLQAHRNLHTPVRGSP